MTTASTSVAKDIFNRNVAQKFAQMVNFNRVYPMELFQLFLICSLKSPIKLTAINPHCVRILQRYNLLDNDANIDAVTAYVVDYYMTYSKATRSIRFI